MVTALSALEDRFVEAMAIFAKEAGIVGAAEGRILGRIILADKPLTQDELMELTGASRGAVSMSLRTLTEAGFVRKCFVKDSRRDHYEAPESLWRITIGFVLARIGRQIEWVNSEFTEILAAARNLKNSAPEAVQRRAAARLVNRIGKFQVYTVGALDLIATVQKLVSKKVKTEVRTDVS